MVRGLRVLGVGCLVLALAAGQALAQEKGKRGPGGFGMGMGMGGPGGQGMTLMLLQAVKVQKELDLVQDQKDKLKELSGKFQGEMREQFSGMGDLRDLSQEERQAKMKEIQEKAAEVTKKFQKQADEILLRTQGERLKEISLQLRGTQALMDKEVADKLKIDDDQKERIQAAQRSVFEKARDLFAGGDREKAMEKMRDLQKEASEKAMDVLTAEQKEQFAKMKGDKVDFTMQDVFPQMGRPGGKGKGKGPAKPE
jgi:hypothetical protein